MAKFIELTVLYSEKKDCNNINSQKFTFNTDFIEKYWCWNDENNETDGTWVRLFKFGRKKFLSIDFKVAETIEQITALIKKE